MMAVEVQTTQAFRAGNPRMLFETKFAFSDIAAHDVTADGKTIWMSAAGILLLLAGMIAGYMCGSMASNSTQDAGTQA
jgi:hypothetical protein